MHVNTDLEIARAAKMQHIVTIAEKLNIKADQMELYGQYKAKLPLDLIDDAKVSRNKLILVTALTPTPAGEGKTTVSIGLSEGLNKIGKQAMVVIREPSLGPVFGIKGGATGGGYSQVVPMEDINLHFTGDFSAIEKANNLLAALIDNNIQSKTRSLGIDPRTVLWKRVMDMNDRSLRHIVTGLRGTANGVPRESGFDITAASEIMAILCLSNTLAELKEKCGNILVGFTAGKKPVFARDLNAQGAMALLLKDAIKPNLVQTLEGNPALIHGGPFANIAQGTNSVIATKMGLSLSDYVVTEAGFGSDLGAEKFLNIKCSAANLKPSAVVIVATIRALRYHGGANKNEWNTPDAERVETGFENLRKHIENMRLFGITPVVAINHFLSDTLEEVALVQRKCSEMNVKAMLSEGWAQGGNGTVDLAKAVVENIGSETRNFRPLYHWNTPVKDKIAVISEKIYGAAGVRYEKKALADLKRIHALELDHLPICMAKTQKSFSDNDTLRGCPTGFNITVREIEIASGAGFLIPITGNMMRMPGLPEVPAAEHQDIDQNGGISGLF